MPSGAAESLPYASRAWELQAAALTIGIAVAGAIMQAAGGGALAAAGWTLVGCAIALDLYVRLLGATSAARADGGGGGGWMLACALGGSPAAAAHALTRRRGPLGLYAEPLGALLGIAALLAALVGAAS